MAAGSVAQRQQKTSKKGYAPDISVPELICRHVAETPERPAIRFGMRSLSYGQLSREAIDLSAQLAAAGVQREDVVAICLERSPEFVAAALAIWRAGGAYLPLDPAYPAEHLEELLRDSRAKALVTRPQISSRLRFEQQAVYVDSAVPAAGVEYAPPAASVSMNDLAYVIYTSGSTGSSKGVEVTHGNLTSLIEWHCSAFRVTSADRASQVAGLGFDAAGWELWPYLSAGSSVTFVPEDIRTDPERLRDWFVASRITIGFVPTALAEYLIGFEWPADAALRLLLTGGDALRQYAPESLPFDLVNNYGPTECTVVATSGVVPRRENGSEFPSIGSAIAGTNVYLLDEGLRPVARGHAGEICIGGKGVARGYRHRPELTAGRFVPDPFSSEADARLYRTGDMGRVLPTGEIEFLGRMDEQIKVSGYRIEPHQIIRAMQRHPAVHSAAVIAREERPGVKQLIAYVVPKRGASVSAAELRQAIEKALPSYMVPAAYVRMEQLPLTPNGKTDRAALPPPDASNTLREHIASNAGNGIEQRVATILCGLLGLDEVEAQDDFFLLGGHSLLGAQLIARLRDEFGVELSLRSLFETSTVAELAAEVGRRMGANVGAAAAGAQQARSGDDSMDGGRA